MRVADGGNTTEKLLQLAMVKLVLRHDEDDIEGGQFSGHHFRCGADGSGAIESRRSGQRHCSRWRLDRSHTGSPDDCPRNSSGSSETIDQEKLHSF